MSEAGGSGFFFPWWPADGLKAVVGSGLRLDPSIWNPFSSRAIYFPLTVAMTPSMVHVARETNRTSPLTSTARARFTGRAAEGGGETLSAVASLQSRIVELGNHRNTSDLDTEFH